MAKTYGFQIASQLASKHLIDADNVKGGFCVVATTSDRDELPAAYGVTDGIITKGSLVYCQSSSELYVCTGVELVGSKPTATWTEFVSGGDVNPMVFMGTLGSNDATISVLPDTSSANKGNVYKVKTEGTYTYNTDMSVTVKVGDTLISNETEWVVIPSGDEPTYQSLSESQNSSEVSLVTRGEKYTWNHSFLPLSGGMLNNTSTDTPLRVKGNSTTQTFIQYQNSGGTSMGYIGVKDSGSGVYKPYFFDSSAKQIALSAETPYIYNDTYPTLMPAKDTNNWIKIGTTNSANQGLGYGLLPQQQGSAGSGHGYIGVSSWYWKYAYIDEIYSTGGNRVPVVQTASSVPSSMTTGVLYLISG